MKKIIAKYVVFCAIAFGYFASAKAQQEVNVLPLEMFKTLQQSTTQVDVVYHFPATASLSMEGINVLMFNTFVENASVVDTFQRKADGFVMWLINGREFLQADFFLGEKVSCFKFKTKDKIFVNRMSKQGAVFLKQEKH